jgi:hypothetical protein
MPFLLDNNASPSELSDAVNYLLANFGSNLAADPSTGEISGPSGVILSYLYKYLAVKYADSADGSVNFSNSPTNRLYYGLRNTNDSTESVNPADYLWNKVAGGGFSTTKFLFYQTNGGHQINFVVDTVAPDATYLQELGTSIDLDVVTTTTAYSTAAPSIYIWTSTSTPPARPATTSTYTWSTGDYTAPAGWTTAPITNTTPGNYLWAITIVLVVNSNTVTSVLDWTNVAYPLYSFSYNGDDGASGDSVDIVFKRSATQPATPAPSVGTPATWYTDVNSVPAGTDPIWSSVGTNTGTGTNYVWQTPVLIEGQNGTDGLSVAEVLIYLRSSTAPATPTGGSYDFSTQTLTPPAGWSSGIPAGTDPVYTSRAVASVQGTTGTDTTLTWSSPVLSIQNGATGATGATGDAGISAITAFLAQDQSLAAPGTPSNTTGPTAPFGWSLVAPAVSVGQVLWYSFGRYNSSASTLDGVPAGQTAWGVPTAASVFQDIRSDNWNGSNPPTAGTVATHGTAGYYIQRSTGDMYLNSVYGRGVARFDGLNSGTGGVTSAILANPSLSQNTGVEAYTNNTFPTAGAFRAFNQGAGAGNAIYALHSGSGYGIFSSSTSGTGVLGSGFTGVSGVGTIGLQGNGSGPGGLGVQAQDLGGGTAALDVVGSMRINNSTLVTNLNADLLDGNHASAFLPVGGTATNSSALGGIVDTSWARIFPTNSGVANAGGSGVNLLGSTSTGIAGAYVGTSGTSNIVTWTVQTTSPSDIRLKEEIADTDLGLAFVNKLRPVSYKLKADPKHQKGYGFIADEVEELIGLDSSLVYHEPDWKVGDEQGFKTIHYPSYIAVLTKAIQELSAEIALLKAKG